jgi:hypothetical protein
MVNSKILTNRVNTLEHAIDESKETLEEFSRKLDLFEIKIDKLANIIKNNKKIDASDDKLYKKLAFIGSFVLFVENTISYKRCINENKKSHEIIHINCYSNNTSFISAMIDLEGGLIQNQIMSFINKNDVLSLSLDENYTVCLNPDQIIVVLADIELDVYVDNGNISKISYKNS